VKNVLLLTCDGGVYFPSEVLSSALVGSGSLLIGVCRREVCPGRGWLNLVLCSERFFVCVYYCTTRDQLWRDLFAACCGLYLSPVGVLLYNGMEKKLGLTDNLSLLWVFGLGVWFGVAETKSNNALLALLMWYSNNTYCYYVVFRLSNLSYVIINTSGWKTKNLKNYVYPCSKLIFYIFLIIDSRESQLRTQEFFGEGFQQIQLRTEGR
jgi:hypothetical protein